MLDWCLYLYYKTKEKMEKKLTKTNKKKLEKVVSNIETQLIRLEMRMTNAPTAMRAEIWKEYVRVTNYKKELQNLINN